MFYTFDHPRSSLVTEYNMAQARRKRQRRCRDDGETKGGDEGGPVGRTVDEVSTSSISDHGWRPWSRDDVVFWPSRKKRDDVETMGETTSHGHQKFSINDRFLLDFRIENRPRFRLQYIR